MKAKHIKKNSHTDWGKLESLKDDEINFSDRAPLDHAFFAQAELRVPQAKSLVTMRLDPDILGWLRSQGKGYQTRINAILRLYMDAQQNRLESQS